MGKIKVNLTKNSVPNRQTQKTTGTNIMIYFGLKSIGKFDVSLGVSNQDPLH